MNQTVSIVCRITGQTQTAAQIVCHFQFMLPKFMINLTFLEREHAHGNTSYLEMPASYKLFLRSVHIHYLAFFGFSLNALDSSGEYPRMKTL